MDKALTWFIRLWLGLALLVNLAAVAGLMLTAPGFWAGLGRVAEIYSPFNVINYLAELALLSPALGAYLWREKRRARVAG